MDKPQQRLTINDNSGYGGGNLDPQSLQMLAAALAQSGALPPPKGEGQHTLSAPPDTWENRAYNAPRVGGQGNTPGGPVDGLTPESMAGGASPRPDMGGLGGMTPPDPAGAGRSPYIINQIPDLPPIDRTGVPMPIPTDTSMFGGQMQPINNMPFGFGGLFGGGY